MTMHYPFPDAPVPGTVIEISPGLWWLRMGLPFQLDHINLWLLQDEGGWCIVDTGFPSDETRASWESLLAGLDGPVTRIIATHFHPDHLGLAHWLMEKTGAPLTMTTGEFLTAHAAWSEVGGHGARFMVEQFREHGLDGERLEKFAKRGSGYRQAIPALPEHYHRIRAGDTLKIGCCVWEVIPGYGHSPEHAALYCAESGVLISGDMLLPRISTNISVFAATPEADALGWYLDSLQSYAQRFPEETLVLPSHGLPFKGIQARVEALHAHHEERLHVLEETCEAPQSAASVLGVLFPRPLDMHQTMFAMGEAIAHLNHLERKGRLRRHRDADGVFRFERVPLAA